MFVKIWIYCTQLALHSGTFGSSGEDRKDETEEQNSLCSHYHLPLSPDVAQSHSSSVSKLLLCVPILLFPYIKWKKIRKMELATSALLVLGRGLSWKFNTFLKAWNNAREKEWAHALRKVAPFFA